MGIVAFEWGENQLTLLQNREKCDSSETKPAAWDKYNKILSGLTENEFGTWFGISREGKVAFLVQPEFSDNFVSLMVPPIVFLQNKLSLDEYANHMCQESNYGETTNKGVIYDIIVADINAKSMVHIYKKDTTKTKYAEKKKVDFGVHTLSSQSRFDSGSFKDICMKSLFSKMIRDYKKEQVLPLEKMAKEFVFDPVKADFDIAGCSWIPDKEDQFRAMSTIAMEVKPNKKKECSMKGMWTKMATGKRISSLSR